MAFFSELTQHLDVLRGALGGDVEAVGLPITLDQLADDAIVAVLAAATGLVRAGEKVRIAASGVAAARSTRDAGHEGLSQRRGHRSPTSLIQEITGATRAEAAKHVRLGESLRTAAGLGGVGADDEGMTDASTPGDAAPTPVSPVEPWHAPLGRALLDGTIGSAQHDAILRGLGEPPVAHLANATGVTEAAAADAVCEAWSVAAEQLIAEAQVRTVEELARTARTVRDQLDPEGAQRRFDERFQGRAFRVWRDGEGIQRGSIVFEDYGGAWTRTILDSALRPRRGGPRFVDPDEKAKGDELSADPRTDAQLAYDLLLDVLRAGALAEPAAVFGTRQAGVRVLVTRPAYDGDRLDRGGRDSGGPGVDRGGGDSGAPGGPGGGGNSGDPGDRGDRGDRGGGDSGDRGNRGDRGGGDPGSPRGDRLDRGGGGTGAPGVGLTEDDQTVLPVWLIRQQICDSGTVACTLDSSGNPLDLGREQRLFTPKQRIALAARDGGCRWRGCDRPASYCEAHHIDAYSQGGRTDIDRGILLCRWHHMELHHGGWRITREGHQDFVLHPPPGRGDAIALPPRLALRYAWADLDPPPKRFHPTTSGTLPSAAKEVSGAAPAAS